MVVVGVNSSGINGPFISWLKSTFPVCPGQVIFVIGAAFLLSN